jgi:hypothetical protein
LWGNGLTVGKFFAGNDENAATHLKGLQAIVASRGGLERGDFDRFTIYNLTGSELASRFMFTG